MASHRSIAVASQRPQGFHMDNGKRFDGHLLRDDLVGPLTPLDPIYQSFSLITVIKYRVYGVPLPTPTEVIDEMILEYQGTPSGKSSFTGAAPSLASEVSFPAPKIMY